MQGVELALVALKNSVNQIWGLSSTFDNEDVADKVICNINIKIETLQARSSNIASYKYYISGILQLPLETPCMKPKGFLIDRFNYFSLKNKYNGLTIELAEEYSNNTANVNFWYESAKIDICQKIENISEVVINTEASYS